MINSSRIQGEWLNSKGISTFNRDCNFQQLLISKTQLCCELCNKAPRNVQQLIRLRYQKGTIKVRTMHQQETDANNKNRTPQKYILHPVDRFDFLSIPLLCCIDTISRMEHTRIAIALFMCLNVTSPPSGRRLDRKTELFAFVKVVFCKKRAFIKYSLKLVLNT